MTCKQMQIPFLVLSPWGYWGGGEPKARFASRCQPCNLIKKVEKVQIITCEL